MWTLIKKDLIRIISYILPVFIIFAYFLFMEASSFKDKPPFFWGIWMLILVTGGISTVEKYEGKHHGYRFLTQLPISPLEIVKSKFIILLVSVVFVGILNFIISFVFTMPEELAQVSRSFIMFFIWVFLLVMGSMYILIFKKGLTKAMTIIWISVIGGIFLFLFGFDYLLKLFDISISELVDLTANLSFVSWIILSVIALWVYYQLMKIATRTFARALLNEVH